MKKFLFAALLFVGLAVAAPVAEAGQFARVYNGRGVVYVHKSQLYAPYAYGNRHYRHHSRLYAYRPYYYNAYRPRYVSYPYYSDYGYSRPYCGYYSRPRVAISFGF